MDLKRLLLTAETATSGREGPTVEAGGEQAQAQTSRGAGLGGRLPRSEAGELPPAESAAASAAGLGGSRPRTEVGALAPAASAAARAATARASTSTAKACSAAAPSLTPTGTRARRVAWRVTSRSRAPDGGTPGTAAAAARESSYRWGRTHRLASARPRSRTRWRTRTGVAAAKSCTSAGARRPVVPAASTLNLQTGQPVVAGGSSEGIRVWDPPVVAEGRTVEGPVGRPLVLAAGSTTGGGGPVGGPPGVDGGCAKWARVTGLLVDEAKSTD